MSRQIVIQLPDQVKRSVRQAATRETSLLIRQQDTTYPGPSLRYRDRSGGWVRIVKHVQVAPLVRRHQDVHECVLHQGAEHEQGAAGHEDVDGFDVGDGRQGLLRLSMLRAQREERCHTEGDAGRHCVRLDPEGDPGHDHNKACRDVAENHLFHQFRLSQMVLLLLTCGKCNSRYDVSAGISPPRK